MNFLKSSLGMAVLAVVVYALTMGGLFVTGINKIVPEQKGLSVHDLTAEDPEYRMWNFHSHEINKLIEDLNMERTSLSKKEEDLSITESRVNAEIKELKRIKDEIQNYRKELSQYLIEVQGSELKNLKTEVSVLGNMDPSSVVAVFAEKTDEEIVKLLALMKPDAIAPIMETMMKEEGGGSVPSAKRAARILEKLQRFKAIRDNK
jgi:flagellar motility protein MotE (MotC chaperone)